MTKKHFKALADILREHKEQLDYIQAKNDEGWNTKELNDRTYKQLVDAVADLCGDTNPNFRYSTFREACNANQVRCTT